MLWGLLCFIILARLARQVDIFIFNNKQYKYDSEQGMDEFVASDTS